jgi:hypothetical protein
MVLFMIHPFHKMAQFFAGCQDVGCVNTVADRYRIYPSGGEFSQTPIEAYFSMRWSINLEEFIFFRR